MMEDGKPILLNRILNDLRSFAIAFSGGVDSSYLLHMASRIRSADILAVTVRTPYIPAWEIEEATVFTASLGIRHTILDLPFPEKIRSNPADRCYLCKKTLFEKIIEHVGEYGYEHILDGSNADDAGSYRPGMKALKEMGVRSPLMEVGLTKDEIRNLLKEEGLEIWEKPAMACLLTRIPYDTDVSEELLRSIERAENILLDFGYIGTRVRAHGNVARLECLPGYMEKLLHDPEKEMIIAGIKKTGFRYVSLDLEGYRSGSYDPQT